MSRDGFKTAMSFNYLVVNGRKAKRIIREKGNHSRIILGHSYENENQQMKWAAFAQKGEAVNRQQESTDPHQMLSISRQLHTLPIAANAVVAHVATQRDHSEDRAVLSRAIDTSRRRWT